MAPHIVIAVGIASYPCHSAGNTWAFLQWVLGFRQAGWDVWMVENVSAAKCIDSDGSPCSFSESANLAHWNHVVEEFDLSERATLFLDGESTDLPELLRFSQDAKLLFNISGHFRHSEIFRSVGKRVYVDLDPCFTQMRSEVYGCDMNFKDHDVFVSVGRLLNSGACHAPLCGKNWLPIGTPVVLDYFPESPTGSISSAWTTFTHWYGYSPVEYQGKSYGNKSEEFQHIIDLPSHTQENLEIATDLSMDDPVRRQFSQAGWKIMDAKPLNSPWQAYRDYLAKSKGEFCVAKNGYVRSHCGWFSDRSACYLALGKPVILQDTGWSKVYPTGEGLFSFTSKEGAVSALEQVARNPQRHRLAARRIAEKYFSAPIVVNQFLETARI